MGKEGLCSVLGCRSNSGSAREGQRTRKGGEAAWKHGPGREKQRVRLGEAWGGKGAAVGEGLVRQGRASAKKGWRGGREGRRGGEEPWRDTRNCT